MKRVDTIIGDKQYSILLPSARVAMGLSTRTASLIGPLLGSLGKNSLQGGFEAFSKVLQSVDPEKVDKLLLDAVFKSKLCCNNEDICSELTFDRHFDDNRGDLYQVVSWALWEIVKDFFPWLAAFGQKMMSKAEEMTNLKESKSQQDGK